MVLSRFRARSKYVSMPRAVRSIMKVWHRGSTDGTALCGKMFGAGSPHAVHLKLWPVIAPTCELSQKLPRMFMNPAVVRQRSGRAYYMVAGRSLKWRSPVWDATAAPSFFAAQRRKATDALKLAPGHAKFQILASCRRACSKSGGLEQMAARRPQAHTSGDAPYRNQNTWQVGLKEPKEPLEASLTMNTNSGDLV